MLQEKIEVQGKDTACLKLAHDTMKKERENVKKILQKTKGDANAVFDRIFVELVKSCQETISGDQVAQVTLS